MTNFNWYEAGLRAITIELSDEAMEFENGDTLETFCEDYENELIKEFGNDVEITVSPSDVIGAKPKFVILNDSDLEPEDIDTMPAFFRACDITR